MKYPSIFNDVIGPVMRGPSSSHCAAALRIGRICRNLTQGNLKDILIEFDPTGSLATTHKSQGSDMGLFGGLMGWDADDARLPKYEEAIAAEGWNIHMLKHDIGGGHPNTYKMTFTNEEDTLAVTAISIGGGMIEVIEIDSIPVSIFGDYYETLIYTSKPEEMGSLLDQVNAEESIMHTGKNPFLEIKSKSPIPSSIIESFQHHPTTQKIRVIAPVLPIMSHKDMEVPFRTSAEMLTYCAEHDITLWQAALAYESARGAISKEEVFKKMAVVVDIMSAAVETGLTGTSYEDRILGSQSPNFKKQFESKKLVQGDVLNTIIMYVSAIMEVKSSMGVIVAAPTAGACGALPGTILGAAKVMNKSKDEIIKAMLSAGLIGVFIADQASFAAEVGGCQAECGSGSCMAAAALVTLQGGSVEQSVSAASQALQNSLGMICDPIANRVEAPCLGKNVMAASNALSCANMALADYNHLIPLDQVIQSMARVSAQMAFELRCTGLGGLAITEASKKIEAELKGGTQTEEQLELSAAAKKFEVLLNSGKSKYQERITLNNIVQLAEQLFFGQYTLEPKKLGTIIRNSDLINLSL